jgi:hypothetical protein
MFLNSAFPAAMAGGGGEGTITRAVRNGRKLLARELRFRRSCVSLNN